ncbi:hypothetical protein CEXT_230451 [Caerostris extrusa]|uniref:Uncharacterized protein n=1 Tax=Caerostris extrusa TaxID=172846 RepID=A0AAV4U9K5_CAEEX|nr:hypothetical protein CEXT_230451 [Caerostris extrusa]
MLPAELGCISNLARKISWVGHPCSKLLLDLPPAPAVARNSEKEVFFCNRNLATRCHGTMRNVCLTTALSSSHPRNVAGMPFRSNESFASRISIPRE